MFHTRLKPIVKDFIRLWHLSYSPEYRDSAATYPVAETPLSVLPHLE